MILKPKFFSFFSMEHKIKFECRGGLSGAQVDVTQVSPAETWAKYRLGTDKAEEIRMT